MQTFPSIPGLYYVNEDHILSTAVVYFCVIIADNDFLNDPHNLIY